MSIFAFWLIKPKMYIDETNSDHKNEAVDYSNAVVLSTSLQCGPKKLRMSLILEDDEDE